MTLGLLMGCHNASLPTAQILSQLPAEVQQVYQVRLPNAAGQSSGASLAVRIQSAKDFGVKASTPGAAAYDHTAILAYRVFLVSSGGSPFGLLTPYQSVIVTIAPNNTDAQTVVFSDLPTGSFYACAAAFKHASTFDLVNNITEDIGALTTYSEGPVACSNTGGYSSGRVSVDTSRQLQGSGVVGIALTLRGERGANLESVITVNDGSLI